MVHSMTLIANAIIERRSTKTALITTHGFHDVLESGSQQIYDIYDLFAPLPAPLIPRHLRREIRERVTRDGAVLTPPDEYEVRALVDDLATQGVESIAVGGVIGAAAMVANELFSRDHVRTWLPVGYPDRSHFRDGAVEAVPV